MKDLDCINQIQKVINDPTAELKDLVNEKYGFDRVKNTSKGSGHSKENKILTGGAIPPILIPIIASVVGALAGKIYDTIKEKIQGKRYSISSLKK